MYSTYYTAGLFLNEGYSSTCDLVRSFCATAAAAANVTHIAAACPISATAAAVAAVLYCCLRKLPLMSHIIIILHFISLEPAHYVSPYGL